MSNVVYLPCCQLVYRDHPSRVRKYHSADCPVMPGKEVITLRRAEVASHAESNADELEEDYLDYWADRAFEQGEGR